jgi:hypothetical protein
MIQPVYQTFKELTENKLFRIPDYQRSYSWEKKQRDDLANDLYEIHKKDSDHFMATVVCLKSSKEPIRIASSRLFEYDIVDGQQRITTLVALLKGIEIRLTRDANESDDVRDLNKTLVKGDNRIILLQTNHDESHIFTSFIRDSIIPDNADTFTLAQKNIRDLILWTRKFVDEWISKEYQIIDLLSIIKNQLGFIFFEIEKESIVYTVFEVLNSRGLDVNSLDKAKSTLLGFLYEILETDGSVIAQIDQLKAIWTDIYRAIGIKEVSSEEILTFTMTLLIPHDREKGRLLSAIESLELLRELTRNNAARCIEIAQLFLSIANKFKELKSLIHLEFHQSISQSRLIYCAIKLSPHLNEIERKTLLEYWEKVIFKVYGLTKKDSKKNAGDFIRLSREIFNGQIKNIYHQTNQNSEFNLFNRKSFVDRTKERLLLIHNLENLDKILEEFKQSDRYTEWKQELRYFLYKIEELIASKRRASIPPSFMAIFHQNEDETIEHIFPKEDPQRRWTGLMGQGNGVIQNNVHRLGNLMLLEKSLNSQCGTKSFSDKKEIYKNSMLHHVYDVVYKNYTNEGNRAELNEWNKDQIEKREKRLLILAKEIWELNNDV